MGNGLISLLKNMVSRPSGLSLIFFTRSFLVCQLGSYFDSDEVRLSYFVSPSYLSMLSSSKP